KLGAPFEGELFEEPYAQIWSDGIQAHLDPHYEISMHDHFWVKPDGDTDATGVYNFVPIDLGSQDANLSGMADIYAEAARRLAAAGDPRGDTVQRIVAQMKAHNGGTLPKLPDHCRRGFGTRFVAALMRVFTLDELLLSSRGDALKPIIDQRQ